MKTIRTMLATFGMTTLLYGGFALLCVTVDPAFAGRSIYQMFRDTGFPAVVIGIACLLSVIIISFAVAAFRDEPRSRRSAEQDDEEFLENETVAVEDYDADEWTPAMKKKSRAALAYEQDADEDEDDDSAYARPRKQKMRHCLFCGAAFPAGSAVCPKCGKRA